jgi:hypothetical protein
MPGFRLLPLPKRSGLTEAGQFPLYFEMMPVMPGSLKKRGAYDLLYLVSVYKVPFLVCHSGIVSSRNPCISL